MKLGLLAVGIAMILIGGGMAAWVFSPGSDQAFMDLDKQLNRKSLLSITHMLTTW
jgi:hypothetical protein